MAGWLGLVSVRAISSLEMAETLGCGRCRSSEIGGLAGLAWLVSVGAISALEMAETLGSGWCRSSEIGGMAGLAWLVSVGGNQCYLRKLGVEGTARAGALCRHG